MPPSRQSFSKQNPKLQIVWDATSSTALKRCPRYYEYNILEGYVGKVENVHLRWGIEYNNAQVTYNVARAKGEDHEQATLSAVRYALEATWNATLGRPWTSDLPVKTRETLLRSLVWYLDRFAEDSCKTVTLADGEAAVSLNFLIHLDEFSDLTGEQYALCGELDRVVTFDGGKYIADWKAQPITARVLTDNGWTTIGELHVGDLIATASGEFHSIRSILPKGKTSAYRISFNDNTSTECGEDHLWQIADNGKFNWHVKRLKDIIYPIAKGKRYRIPVTEPVQHSEKKLPLDPYLLGVLLGNGYLNGNSVSISSSDHTLMQRVRMRLQPGEILYKTPSENLSWIIKGDETFTGNRLTACKTLIALRSLGLWGKVAGEKFIPYQYLFGSISQRKDLLKGLLDTDGSWDEQYLRYQTTSKVLATNVCDLIRSLGGAASMSSIVDFSTRTGILFKIRVRTIDTPAGIRKKYIKKIEKIEDTETVCIEVDCADGLYLTDNYIVTHNSTKSPLDEKYFADYSPNNQVSQYTFAGKVIDGDEIKGVIIDAVQLGVTFSRFERRAINRTAAQLEEWLADSLVFIRQNETYVRANHWPLNDSACGMYGGCPYRGICSLTPGLRQQHLDTLYERRVWDPVVKREI